MDELHLSETEQRYFSDLFLCCDNESTGKVTIQSAVELFRTGNISNEILNQIMDLCCTNQNQQQSIGYLNRKQFYSILKLIAAHQANVTIRSDLLTNPIELPLPRFTWANSVDTQSNRTSDLIELSNDLRDQDVHSTYKHHDSISTDSEVETREDIVNGGGTASSTTSDSPTPTNSVQERAWAVSTNWQGLVCEEQRQLLGTEEESSDKHSSDDDTDITNEVWTITSEQREYYTKQFRSLQPDPNGLLAGSIARLFFEKSRLPVAELRKIWQLADVTKDGALSLKEFNTAMHLVVLRRNHIALPSNLPPQLLPDRSGAETPPPPNIESTVSKEITAKEWTKFVDSPTSSISSPGPKPVNFDFQKASVEKDPKILHPVPLRLTPDLATATVTPQILDEHETEQKIVENNQNQNDIRAIQRPQAKKMLGVPGAIPPPPLPLPLPLPQALEEGPVSLPAPKKEPPPPPPPRPFRSHGRSSSLDLNRLGKNGFLGTPPTIPPRISPNIPSPNKKLINQRSEGDVINAFANFDQFPPAASAVPEKYENVQDVDISVDVIDHVPRKHGAFEVYRKPACRSKESPIPVEETAKWELFKKLKEQNTVLLRLCQELSHELADVREERTMLRLHLEQEQQQQEQQPQQSSD